MNRELTISQKPRALGHGSRIQDLVITNVPYLSRGRQAAPLSDYCDQYFAEAKHELANVFLERCLELSLQDSCGHVQVVMPQNWLFLARFKSQRQSLLKSVSWNLVVRLGAGAFETISGEVVQAILLTMGRSSPGTSGYLVGLDASSKKSINEKILELKDGELLPVKQVDILANPDSVVSFEEVSGDSLLSDFAHSYTGAHTLDISQFRLCYWEVQADENWSFHMSTPERGLPYSGLSYVSFSREEGKKFASLAASMKEEGFLGGWLSGRKAWGRPGVACSWMNDLPASIYTGCVYDNMVAAIVPNEPENLLPIWAFCSSPDFNIAVRKLNQKMQVANSTLVKVPFNLAHWRTVAAERYPNGLPKPYSDDPTQWLFHGHPQPATDPLQVAVARLAGYRWPAETDTAMELAEEARTWIARCEKLAEHTDDDGIVCLPSVRGEAPAHDRLLKLLIAAWETVQPGSWKPAVLDKLLADAECAGKGLDVWLREKFFEQHAKRFQHRPFIWHVWDGLKDGFAALVNYHQLDHKKLERLIHTYLGDWIRQQEAGVRDGIDGAPTRLAAAQDLKRRLELILEGEQPYDIFVRWKPLTEQPIGWNPDLNDGVRLNIRPFMTAEVLRHNKKPKLNITWDKDRGKDVESAPWFKVFQGDRINDHHLTVAEKITSRGRVS